MVLNPANEKAYAKLKNPGRSQEILNLEIDCASFHFRKTSTEVVRNTEFNKMNKLIQQVICSAIA